MAITYIDPAQGALADALVRLGDAAANRINERKIRAKTFQSDPAQMQSLSAAYRAAKDAGQGPTFLEAINVDQEFGGLLDSYQPTTSERLERARLQEGVPEIQAGAEAAGGKVDLRTSQAALSLNAPENAIRSQVMKNMYEGATFEEAMKQNVPALQAIAQARGAEFDANKFQYEGELMNYRRENGVDVANINLESLKTRIGAQAGQQYFNYVKSLTPGSKEAVHAAMALENPAYLNHLEELSRLDLARQQFAFEQSLKKAAAQGATREDQIKLTFQLDSQIQDAHDALMKAQKDGTKTDVEIAAKRYNNLRYMDSQLQLEGFVLPRDVTGVNPKGRKYEAFFQNVESPTVAAAYGAYGGYIEEGATPEEALAKLKEVDAQGQSMWGVFTPREREEFTTGIAEIGRVAQEQSKKAEREERGYNPLLRPDPNLPFGQQFGQHPLGALGNAGMAILKYPFQYILEHPEVMQQSAGIP